MAEPAIQSFLDEANELLQQMEHILLDAEHAQRDVELLNALFRTMHTIKGSAGLFALDEIVAFTHEVENVLDLLRLGELSLHEELTSLLLRCRDCVALMVKAVANQGVAPSSAEQQALLQQLKQYQKHTQVQPDTESERVIEAETWLMYLGFGTDLLRNGLDPASFLRFLLRKGQIEDLLPLFKMGEVFDPELNFLHFALRFHGQASETELYSVFEFANEGSLILIAPLAQANDYLQRSKLAAEDLKPIRQAWEALGLGSQSAPPAKRAKSGEATFLRVEADKLDTLINLIGELVISGAAGNLLASQNGAAALQEWSLSMSGLIEQIRAGALSMRMAQVGEVFQRFPRVVRDVAKELGKEMSLEISGAETELDKSMIEKLADPLMHLVRNAIDHGIEPKENRIKAGKPIHGMVYLNAYHESGSVMIEVSDDGAGLQREKILAKAVARGLVSADAALSEQEIFALIFEAGFSTAEQVTSLSGRGVGMDVVKRSVDALRGSVMVDSEFGVGTIFRIRLPLTLAIIDGFLVKSANATYVLPLEAVIECIELPTELVANDSLDHLNLRGELLPLLRLSSFLDLDRDGVNESHANVVVLRANDRKVGVVVDDLLGEFQTVIKPLGSLFRHLKAIGGSTILGNGQVALILDVGELVQHVTLRDAERFSLSHELALRQTTL